MFALMAALFGLCWTAPALAAQHDGQSAVDEMFQAAPFEGGMQQDGGDPVAPDPRTGAQVQEDDRDPDDAHLWDVPGLMVHQGGRGVTNPAPWLRARHCTAVRLRPPA